jgi:hypothetical protein
VDAWNVIIWQTFNRGTRAMFRGLGKISQQNLSIGHQRTMRRPKSRQQRKSLP